MTDHERDEFERLLGELRPKLHRYSARMSGSAVDGEDIVQDAMVKAFIALPNVGVVDNPEGWLFRIVHNTALDFLRRRARGPVLQVRRPSTQSPQQILSMTAMRLLQRVCGRSCGFRRSSAAR